MASITGREGSLLERALAIHEADIIVAPHGGQCFNLVFARPGTIFVEILPGMSAVSACVHVLSPSRALPHLRSMLSRIQGRRKRTQTHVGFVFLFWQDSRLCVCVCAVSYTSLRAHETLRDLVCPLVLEKKKRNI